ncbi:MAG TPA: AfsR/SARP family transcriptional regulator [Pseudonocardiaceae bacterium]|nr:AfsR/SARP family transcriptional regulator [Pseudonocardiaceae bacterium]
MVVRTRDGVRTPSASKIRQVLALMLLRANQVVSLDTAIEELWAQRPPRTAVTVVQTYVYQLRKRLTGPGDRQWIRTVAPGYVLDVPQEDVDSWRFNAFVDRGRLAMEAERPAEAVTLLTTALDMWHGSVLENVEHGPVLERYAAGLEDQRMLAIELRLRANLSIGRHREVIPELRTLVAAHPYHEWLYAQLITALHRAGRRGEALDVYQKLRRVLNTDLGLEPSEDVQQIQHSVLNAEPAGVA